MSCWLRVALTVFLLQAFFRVAAVVHAGFPDSGGANSGAAPAESTIKGLAEVDIDVENLHLQPGLIGSYRTGHTMDRDPDFVRVDAKPSLTLTAGSLHPRMKPGGFSVVWEGLIQIRELDTVRFGAFVRGEVLLEIGGTVALRSRSESMTQHVTNPEPIACVPGFYAIRIVYRSLAAPPSRLQIWWEGETFSREPLPATRFHYDSDVAGNRLAVEALRETGRATAQQLGCAGCHRTAFPSSRSYPAGPALVDLPERVSRSWLLRWLADPAKQRDDARMPALFADDRRGFLERSLVANYLLRRGPTADPVAPQATVAVDNEVLERGRRRFLTVGCAACHLPPDHTSTDLGIHRVPFTGIASRMTDDHLIRFLRDPRQRYTDGRMPNLRLPQTDAEQISAYLLAHTTTEPTKHADPVAPQSDEVERLVRQLGADSAETAGRMLVQQKGCIACHKGIDTLPQKGPGQDDPAEVSRVADVPIKLPDSDSWSEQGCLSGKTLPRFHLSKEAHRALKSFVSVAAQERHPSAFEHRRQLLTRLGCARCHQRDTEQRPMIERVAQEIWIKSKHFVYQRTPALTGALEKYRLDYLRSAISAGVSGQRPRWYSYRMPAFGDHSEEVIRALAESDGEFLRAQSDPPPVEIDPNMRDFGHLLVGFKGYSCVSCHVWKGDTLRVVEPSAAGPELTTVTKRIRREWFDRWLENPLRIHPRTPMPAVFRKGQPASIVHVLDGDPAKQREALWRYFSRGEAAPDPRQKPPFTLAGPGLHEPSQVAQIPLRTPSLELIESISLLNNNHDLVVYDVARMAIHNVYLGAELVCTDGYGKGRSGYFRNLSSRGTPAFSSLPASPELDLGPLIETPTEQMVAREFLGYDRLSDGIRVHSRYRTPSLAVELTETLKVDRRRNRLKLRLMTSSLPRGASLRWRTGAARDPRMQDLVVTAHQGRVRQNDEATVLRLTPAAESNRIEVSLEFRLPPTKQLSDLSTSANTEQVVAIGEEFFERDRSRLERPGYRAIRYPRPRTAAGEDLVMPYAMAADPESGQLYLASNKYGELFRLDDPTDDGQAAEFVNFTRGRFQDVFGLYHDGQALYVVHRRNLTRILDVNNDGWGDRFERVAQINHAVAEQYDWAYGLVKDRAGNFLLSLAPFGNAHQVGAGSVLRLSQQSDRRQTGPEAEEVAFGLRNPFGWSTGPGGDVFFTDNQGNWVETNKLCQLEEGRFYGFVNDEQPQHRTKPRGSTAVWIPYRWAQSINGLAYNHSSDGFGPFAGQFFLAELMRGGAIVRAQVEKVNGVYQGACFPFWGKGLMGPLALCFDRHGRLYVGSITEPGWMSQPDRGGLFRIDFTGETPFEIQAIHVRPRGFQLKFTKPVSRSAAGQVGAYRIEHYHYRYSSNYGSPELDRRALAVQKVTLSANGREVELETSALETGRIYEIRVDGVSSAQDEPLVHSTGVYTLNELPSE